MALDPFERMHPEDRPRCEKAFAELLRTPSLALQLEHRVRHKDGSWRWMQGTFASLFDDPEVAGLLATMRDFTESKRAEEALRESEERQSFLLKLSDALRPLDDPAEIRNVAMRVLGQHLRINRAQYYEVDHTGEYLEPRGGYTDGSPPAVGRFRMNDFSSYVGEAHRAGRTSVVSNIHAEPRLDEAERRRCALLGFRAFVGVPLVKNGRFVATLGVTHDGPRGWPDEYIALIEETAERTWEAVERARAEAALAESEEQYRTLFTSIDEGFCKIEVLFGGRGEAVDYRFLEANPAFGRQTGLENTVGRTVRELAPEHEGFWFEIYGRIARTGEAMRFEHEAAALGSYYDVYAFRIGEPGENRVAIIFNDILARKRAEEERERLRALEASARAEDSERRRIGRELHDRVAHTMGVAHQSLELHAALVTSAPERAREKLELARECTKTALDQTRDLSAQLARPETEETHDGLAAALRELLETHLPEGMDADISVKGDETAVPPSVREQAYLVMREAVRNAVAHSGANG